MDFNQKQSIADKREKKAANKRPTSTPKGSKNARKGRRPDDDRFQSNVVSKEGHGRANWGKWKDDIRDGVEYS